MEAQRKWKDSKEEIMKIWHCIKRQIEESKETGLYNEEKLAEWLIRHGAKGCVNNNKVLIDFNWPTPPQELLQSDDSIIHGTILDALDFALTLALPNAWTEEVL